MAETLSQKQRRFCRDVSLLIQYAYGEGFELTFGDAYRSPQQAQANAEAGTGISNSLHTQRLAIDLNLFVDDEYQSDTEAHRPLGEFWKSLGEDHCWGGDFSKPDGNHYSIEHGGRK